MKPKLALLLLFAACHTVLLPQVAKSYKQDCLQCHLPATETDFVYVQGYPSIHIRPKTTGEAPNRRGTTNKESLNPAGAYPERGAAVFAKACSVCHEIDSDRRKFGPGLAIIARDGKLPSGKDALPANLLSQITDGGNGMPSFAGAFQPAEKADLIAFILAPK